MRFRAVLLVALLSAAAGAQAPAARRQDSATRSRLEENLRRGLARTVKVRVGLTDDQMSRLGPIARRYEQERRQLQLQERDARQSLRAALRNEQTADQRLVDRQLQTLLDVQKGRAELLESEQRDLATIMTPVQRAKYMALQEQVRRRLEQMRQRRAAAATP